MAYKKPKYQISKQKKTQEVRYSQKIPLQKIE